MKKKIITFLFAGLLPVSALLAQEPMTVAGSMKIATGTNMLTKAELIVTSPDSGVVVNEGNLILKKGVTFHSSDVSDGILVNKGTVDVTASSANPENFQLIKTFTVSGWYYMALPFDFNVSAIEDLTQGGLMVPNSSFLLKLYDGATVASTGVASSWITPTAGTVIPANTGFTFKVSSSRINHAVKFTAATSASAAALFPAAASPKVLNLLHSPSTYGPTFIGWNYIGNTHTAPVSLGLSTTEYRGQAYFWSNIYKTYQAVDLTPTSIEDNIIPPFTGLYLQAVAPGTTFTFKHEGIVDSQVSELRSDAFTGLNLKLTIAGDHDTSRDFTSVVLKENCSSNFSDQEDLPKWFVSEESTTPQLWTLSEDKKELVTNKLPENASSVCLGYKTGIEGNYTISISGGNLNGANEIWLTDNKLGKQVNLVDGGYAFPSGKENFADRFVVTFNKSYTGIKTADSNGVLVYVTDGICHVKGIQSGDQVLVYDISGRTVSREIASGSEYSQTLPSKGIFIIKVSGSANTTVKVRN